MNKKLFIFVLLIILVSFVYQEISITGHTIHYQDDSFESGGRTIKIIKISESNAIIEVDDIKNIVNVGDYKIINGVKVKVISIFYVDEPEERNVDLAINVLDAGSCGDGECKAGETSENCCIDCGCPSDYRCEDNECVYSVASECKKHEDCDDGNPNTIDLCIDDVTKICKHYKPKEEVDEKSIVDDGIEEVGDTVEEEKEQPGFFSKVIIFFKILFSSGK